MNPQFTEKEMIAEHHRVFDLANREKCSYCGGHGADPMSDNVNWLRCPECGGSGRAAIDGDE